MKKPTIGEKMEAWVVLLMIVWLVIGIVHDVLDLVLHHWEITLPLSILVVWWYIFHHGNRK